MMPSYGNAIDHLVDRSLAQQRICQAPLADHQYEVDYRRGYSSASNARAGIGRYRVFYSRPCPHSPLDGKNQDHVYFQSAEVHRGGGITEANIHLEYALHLFSST